MAVNTDKYFCLRPPTSSDFQEYNSTLKSIENIRPIIQGLYFNIGCSLMSQELNFSILNDIKTYKACYIYNHHLQYFYSYPQSQIIQIYYTTRQTQLFNYLTLELQTILIIFFSYKNHLLKIKFYLPSLPADPILLYLHNHPLICICSFLDSHALESYKILYYIIFINRRSSKSMDVSQEKPWIHVGNLNYCKICFKFCKIYLILSQFLQKKACSLNFPQLNEKYNRT